MNEIVENSDKSPFKEFAAPRSAVYYEPENSLELNAIMDDKETEKNTGNEVTKTKEVISTWATNVSCHGIPNIERSTHWVRRIIWLIVFLTGASVMIYLIREQIVLYYSYPVTISVNVTHSREMLFPAVTICNVNPARLSKMSMVSSIKTVITQQTSGTHGHHAGRHQIVQLFHDEWAKIPKSIRQEVGHQGEDLIIDCSFNGATCYVSDFFEWTNPIYGNCFTFNSGLLTDTLLSSTQTGPQYGLTLELNIEQSEYLAEITETAGARLLVHPPDRMPFPENEGYYLEPGQLNSIGLRTENITRLKSPYPSHCIDPPRNIASKYSVYSEKYAVRYTVQACMKTCLQRHMINDCNCSDPKIPNNGEAIIGSASFDSDFYPCTTQSERVCEEDVREKFRTGHLKCDCPTACLDIGYIGTLSQILWPNDVYLDTFLSDLSNRSDSLKTLAKSTSMLALNLIKVEVFFEELNYMLIEEVESYTLFSLVSDIGGLGGLYLGISIVAFFEFIELLIDLISRWGFKFCNMGKTAPKSQGY